LSENYKSVQRCQIKNIAKRARMSPYMYLTGKKRIIMITYSGTVQYGSKVGFCVTEIVKNTIFMLNLAKQKIALGQYFIIQSEISL
jgi:hypothetical protein